MLVVQSLGKSQTQVCVNTLWKLLLLTPLVSRARVPQGAFKARTWKANNCSLGQEQMKYTSEFVHANPRPGSSEKDL